MMVKCEMCVLPHIRGTSSIHCGR